MRQSPRAADRTNATRPTVSGDPQVGEELTANPGTWTGSPTFAYQSQRCDVDAANCFAVTGATGQTYGVRIGDLGYRLRVEVTARKSQGSSTATSAVTSVVQPTTPVTNRRPTLTIVSIRFLGARVYARLRICDDTARNLTILATDSRPRRVSQTRRFSTIAPPNPCGVYTRNWVPAVRFRGKAGTRSRWSRVTRPASRACRRAGRSTARAREGRRHMRPSYFSPPTGSGRRASPTP